MLLTRAMNRTPSRLMIVVSTTVQEPSRTAFWASSWSAWKPDQIWGSTTCSATDTAATVTTEPTSIVQPANHAPKRPFIFLAH
jgi:hypothetical protein